MCKLQLHTTPGKAGFGIEYLICFVMELVLNSFGCRLSRYKGRFKVEVNQNIKLISPYKVKSILLASAASLTTGAILLALEHEIPMVILNEAGKPMGRLWHPGFGSIATIRRNQLQQADDPSMTKWLIQHLSKKVAFQKQFLQRISAGKSAAIQISKSSIQYLVEQEKKLLTLLSQSISEVAGSIRGIEGSMARRYFQTLSQLVPKRYLFTKRSRRPGKDPFNTALNYVYGMLYGKVETALIATGLDPYIPVLHAYGYGKPALVYDFIEAYRPWADEVVMQSCQQKKLKKQHFSEHGQGLRLNKEGRMLLIPAMEDFMEQSIPREEQQVKRSEYIMRDAREFVNLIRAA